MRRLAPYLLLAIVAAAVLLASLWFRAWGGVAFVIVAGVGIAWYRVQVARSAAAEDFFGDGGEETRLTGFQAVSPSEMPVDRQPAAGRTNPP